MAIHAIIDADCTASRYIHRFKVEAGIFFAIYDCLAMIASRCMAQMARTGDFDADDNNNNRRTNRLLYLLRMRVG